VGTIVADRAVAGGEFVEKVCVDPGTRQPGEVAPDTGGVGAAGVGIQWCVGQQIDISGVDDLVALRQRGRGATPATSTGRLLVI
jgi:hypothetical protein